MSVAIFFVRQRATDREWLKKALWSKQRRPEGYFCWGLNDISEPTMWLAIWEHDIPRKGNKRQKHHDSRKTSHIWVRERSLKFSESGGDWFQMKSEIQARANHVNLHRPQVRSPFRNLLALCSMASLSNTVAFKHLKHD